MSSSLVINNSHTWTFELIMGHRWPIWCRVLSDERCQDLPVDGLK